MPLAWHLATFTMCPIVPCSCQGRGRAAAQPGPRLGREAWGVHLRHLGLTLQGNPILQEQRSPGYPKGKENMTDSNT